MSKNGASSVGIIGGADGPTSVFIAGKKRKLPLKQRIKQSWNNYWYKKHRAKVEKTIVANPHTLDEVIGYMQKKYNAQEIATDSKRYIRERKNLCEKTRLSFLINAFCLLFFLI